MPTRAERLRAKHGPLTRLDRRRARRADGQIVWSSGDIFNDDGTDYSEDFGDEAGEHGAWAGRMRVRVHDSGRKRITPRPGTHPDEYIVIQRPERQRNNGNWSRLNLGTPVRNGPRLRWNRANYTYIQGPKGKWLTIKNSGWAKGARWGYEATGLTIQPDGLVVSDSDGSVVTALVPPTYEYDNADGFPEGGEGQWVISATHFTFDSTKRERVETPNDPDPEVDAGYTVSYTPPDPAATADFFDTASYPLTIDPTFTSDADSIGVNWHTARYIDYDNSLGPKAGAYTSTITTAKYWGFTNNSSYYNQGPIYWIGEPGIPYGATITSASFTAVLDSDRGNSAWNYRVGWAQGSSKLGPPSGVFTRDLVSGAAPVGAAWDIDISAVIEDMIAYAGYRTDLRPVIYVIPDQEYTGSNRYDWWTDPEVEIVHTGGAVADYTWETDFQSDTTAPYTANDSDTNSKQWDNSTAVKDGGSTQKTWTRGTSTPSSGTGPTYGFDHNTFSDITSSTDYFLYAETSGVSSSWYWCLESSTLPADSYDLYLSMGYNAYGLGTAFGDLTIWGYNGTTWTLVQRIDCSIGTGALSPTNPRQQSSWRFLGLDLSSYTNSDFKLAIVYTGATSYKGDLGIDSLYVYGISGTTPQTANLGCATAVANGLDASHTAGAVTETLGAATAVANGLDLTETPGTVTLSLGAATAAANGSVITADPGGGPQTANLGAATAAANGLDLTDTGGAVTVTLGAATAVANGLDATDSTTTPQTVNLGAATAVAGATSVVVPSYFEFPGAFGDQLSASHHASVPNPTDTDEEDLTFVVHMQPDDWASGIQGRMLETTQTDKWYMRVREDSGNTKSEIMDRTSPIYSVLHAWGSQFSGRVWFKWELDANDGTGWSVKFHYSTDDVWDVADVTWTSTDWQSDTGESAGVGSGSRSQFYIGNYFDGKVFWAGIYDSGATLRQDAEPTASGYSTVGNQWTLNDVTVTSYTDNQTVTLGAATAAANGLDLTDTTPQTVTLGAATAAANGLDATETPGAVTATLATATAAANGLDATETGTLTLTLGAATAAANGLDAADSTTTPQTVNLGAATAVAAGLDLTETGTLTVTLATAAAVANGFITTQTANYTANLTTATAVATGLDAAANPGVITASPGAATAVAGSFAVTTDGTLGVSLGAATAVANTMATGYTQDATETLGAATAVATGLDPTVDAGQIVSLSAATAAANAIAPTVDAASQANLGAATAVANAVTPTMLPTQFINTGCATAVANSSVVTADAGSAPQTETLGAATAAANATVSTPVSVFTLTLGATTAAANGLAPSTVGGASSLTIGLATAVSTAASPLASAVDEFPGESLTGSLANLKYQCYRFGTSLYIQNLPTTNKPLSNSWVAVGDEFWLTSDYDPHVVIAPTWATIKTDNNSSVHASLNTLLGPYSDVARVHEIDLIELDRTSAVDTVRNTIKVYDEDGRLVGYVPVYSDRTP